MSVTASERPRRAARYGSRLLSIVIGAALACGLAVLLVWHAVLVRIPPGHVGVLYSLLSGGTVTDRNYPEGLALKLPWNTMYIFETRLQALPVALLAFSAEGMPVNVEVTMQYRVKAEMAAALLTNVGMEYSERVVEPVTKAAVRRVIALYHSHELYTVGADQLHAELLDYLRGTPEARYIYYSDTPLRTIRLPDRLVEAIQMKLSEQQRAAAYEFRLASQRQEAERMRIEAIGLRNFYSIVQSSLSDKLLTWRGIEATVEVARSPNTKIVIVGGNKDQMPLILGSEITRAPAPTDQPVPPISGDSSPLPDWTKIPPIFDVLPPGPGPAPPAPAGGDRPPPSKP
jgi:prohibitin 2